MTDDTTETEPVPEAPAAIPAPPAEVAAEPTAGEAFTVAPAAELAAPAIPESPEPASELAELTAGPAPEAVSEPVPETVSEPTAALSVSPDPAPASEPAAIPPPVTSPLPKTPVTTPPPPEVAEENFADLLKAFEKSHTHRTETGPKQLQGTVVSVSADQVFLDIGYKIEGVLPRPSFPNNADTVKPGDTFPVSITGRDEEGYYTLSRFKVAQPKDWTSLQSAFDQKLAVVGTVTAVVKGGASVDVGVRAFMPASRSGTREAAELEALVGQQISCRITKLDVADENVVVDRRVILEEQAKDAAAGRYATLSEGDILHGTVRTLMPYGAFVDLIGPENAGLTGLLHVSDIAWTRIAKPEDALTVGQELEVKVLKIDPETRKISLGLKQLQPEPWQTVPQRFHPGQRVSGTVTRVLEFGAFVEIEPGIEGLIHVSEMSWGKKVRIASDVLKPGERVDAVILNIKLPSEGQAGRISLGLKQTLTDPWADVAQKFPIGSQVSGPVTKIMAFGAFVQIAEGVEGMVHISEITADRRLHHPSDALHVGQVVEAQVLAIEAGKRQIRLSMKQLVPTSIDEYIAEHKPGDTVSGRVVEISPAIVELGEGIRAACRSPSSAAGFAHHMPAAPSGKADLGSLSSLLQARWKGAVLRPQRQARRARNRPDPQLQNPQAKSRVQAD
jgi:small subunit ribosomal protein S1